MLILTARERARRMSPGSHQQHGWSWDQGRVLALDPHLLWGPQAAQRATGPVHRRVFPSRLHISKTFTRLLTQTVADAVAVAHRKDLLQDPVPSNVG